MPRKKQPVEAAASDVLVETAEPQAEPVTGEDSTPDIAALSPERRVEIWNRRFLNPGARPSSPIQLKRDDVEPRWINTELPSRYHEAVYEQGWEVVTKNLLVDANEIPDLQPHPLGWVTRGERGREVLMMIPKDVLRKIQHRKAELHTKSLKNIRHEVAKATEAKYGPEAGDFANEGQTHDGNIKAIGTVTFGKETRAYGDNE